METIRLINLEIAKLASEMNFDWPVCDAFVDLTEPFGGEICAETYKYPQNHNKKGHRFSRPSLEMLGKWLRDVKQIEVYAYPIFKNGKCGYDSFKRLGYVSSVIGPNLGSDTCYHLSHEVFNLFPEDILEDGDKFEDYGINIRDSYEDAYEDGLIIGLKMVNWRDGK